MAPRGKIQQGHFNHFCDLMAQVEWDLHENILESGRVPAEWHKIARGRVEREKVRLTLRVEADVVKFFRAFGKGYQQRMNDVLAAWMHGRLAAVIDGPDAEDIAVSANRYTGRRRIGDLDLIEEGKFRKADGTVIDQTTRGPLESGKERDLP